MDIEKIEYIRRDFKDDLVERLLGSVFHITTKAAFEKIKTDGYVYHNQNGRFPINACSEKSFGRMNGWVCLFDLRNENKQTIKETLKKYPFVSPSWFAYRELEFIEFNLAYLFFHPNEYERLIPKRWQKEGSTFLRPNVGFRGIFRYGALKKHS